MTDIRMAESESTVAAPSDGVVVSVDLIKASHRSDSFPKEWTKEQREKALARYVKFLLLKQRHPKSRLAPTRDIDYFWHLHMLSPVAYYKDCIRLFGRILDHDGGVGKGEGELPLLQQVFTRTAEMWEQEYGEPYLADGRWIKDAVMTDCWHDCEDRCWHACADQD